MKVTASYHLVPLFLFTWISTVFTQNYDFDSHLSIQLYHALDANNPESFTSRGNISINSISSGDLSINQKEISENDRRKLAELAKRNKFYRLRADVVGSDGVKKSYLTSSKACHLLHSQLHDILSFFISADNSGMIGFNHRAVNLDAAPDNCDSIDDHDIDLLFEFSTVATLKKPEIAPIPDTAGFITKIEKEREARDRGETKDNRSFLSKYWMYIVPAVILLLISGITNPAETPAN